MRYPNYLGSSVDPEKLSLTIKSILLGVIPYLGLLNGWFGFDLGESDLRELAESIPNMILAVWAAASSILFVFGSLRRIYYKLTNK